VPFLLGLGCNVPAISGAAQAYRGRERLIASVLISFVPCSARSAIILAIGGKYLGVGRRLRHLRPDLLVIAVLGNCCRGAIRSAPAPAGAGNPALRLPTWRALLARDLGTHQRHPDHRHAAAGGGSVLLALLSTSAPTT
jgi:ferrous iron transport protein B